MAYVQHPGAAVPQKPSKTGIIWAIVIFVVTAILGIVLIVLGAVAIGGAVDDFNAVDTGETRTVQLSNGTYDVYAGETTGRPSQIATMDIQITDPSGDDVSFVSNDSTTTTFETGNDYFEKVGSFDVSSGGRHQPGAYEIEVTGPDGTTARVGQMPYVKIGLLIGGGIAVGGIGFIVALVILIVALVRRSRVKKANRAATYGGPPPGAPYGAPAYGQQPGYGQPAPPAPPAYGTPIPPPAPAAPPAAPTTPPPAPESSGWSPPPAAPPASGSTPPASDSTPPPPAPPA